MNFEVKLFISHPWDRAKLYEELVELLNSANHFRWENLSITYDKAVKVATDEDAIPQRRQLLNARLKDIECKALILELKIAELRKNHAEIKHTLNEIKRFRQIDIEFANAREHILEEGYIERIRYLEKLKRRYAGKDLTSFDTRGSKLEAEIAALEAERKVLYTDAKRCRNALANLGNAVTLGVTGKQRDRIIEHFPNLAIAIRNNIALADAVLAIVFPDSPFRKWLEFEYQEAFVLRKPIIGVLNPGVTDTLPPDMRRYGIAIAKWDASSITQALDDSLLESDLGYFRRSGPTRGVL